MSRPSHCVLLPAAIDGLIALGLAVGAVVAVNEPHIPVGGLAHFLLQRMTVMNTSFAIAFAIMCGQCFSIFGLYRRDAEGMLRLILRTVVSCAVADGLLAGYLEARHANGPIGLIAMGFFAALLTCETSHMLVLHRDCWHIGKPERVIIIGSGRRAGKAWRELRLRQRHAKCLIGFVDDRPCAAMAPDIASRWLGTIEQLPELLRHTVIDELIVASPNRSCYDVAQRAVSIAATAGLRVVYMNDVFTLAEEQSLQAHAPLFVELLAKRQTQHAAGRRAARERLERLTAKEALLKRSTVVS